MALDGGTATLMAAMHRIPGWTSMEAGTTLEPMVTWIILRIVMVTG